MDGVKEIAHDAALKQHIMRTLLYFDIFRYPLKTDEIFRFLGIKCVAPERLEQAIAELVDQACIHRHGLFVGCARADADVIRRKRGNVLAAQMDAKAYRRARLISRFPFVRGVFLSGSYAKGYMDEASDLDFFVVTRPGRLWIARTLIVFYKRLVFFNSHKYFCCNYFVDEDHLEISERNLFTATEVATLKPLWPQHTYDQMIAANAWVRGFFPNWHPVATATTPPASGHLKRFTEWLLSGGWADAADRFFMRITLRRWKKLYGHRFTAEDFELAFKTHTYLSKGHPNHFQRRVLERFQSKVSHFSELHKAVLK